MPPKALERIPREALARLSPTERNVLLLRGRGLSSIAIAGQVDGRYKPEQIDEMLLEIRGKLNGGGKLSLTDLAEQAEHEHTLVAEAGASMIQHAIAAGEALLAAKARVAEREWTQWLREHFPHWSTSTSYTYIQIAKNRDTVLAGGPATLSQAKRLLEGAQIVRLESAVRELAEPHHQAVQLLSDVEYEEPLRTRAPEPAPAPVRVTPRPAPGPRVIQAPPAPSRFVTLTLSRDELEILGDFLGEFIGQADWTTQALDHLRSVHELVIACAEGA